MFEFYRYDQSRTNIIYVPDLLKHPLSGKLWMDIKTVKTDPKNMVDAELVKHIPALTPTDGFVREILEVRPEIVLDLALN